MVGLILVEDPALGKAATLWGSGPGYHVLFGPISILKGRLSPKAGAGQTHWESTCAARGGGSSEEGRRPLENLASSRGRQEKQPLRT